MDSYQRDAAVQKSWILAGVVVVLGFMFFLFKVEACKDDPASYSCHEEFIGLESNSNPRCDRGGIAEAVSVPKPGIMCHCQHVTPDAGK